MAADFPTKVYRPSPEFFSWSGFYIGDWKVDDGTGTIFNIGSGTISRASRSGYPEARSLFRVTILVTS